MQTATLISFKKLHITDNFKYIIHLNFRKMKNYKSIAKKGTALWLLTVLLTFMVKACGKEDNPLGKITMTTVASQVNLVIELTKSSDNLTIDWGDGKKNNVNDAILDGISDRLYFSHEYSDTIASHIVITGNVKVLICSNNKLTALDVSQNTPIKYLNCSNNQLTVINVSKNTVLNNLACNNNQLTSLDVTKNKSLSLISCIGNKLTAPALNDLFSSLPHKRGLEYNEVGDIFISRNPGELDCDRSIAEEKGWVFRNE